MKAVTGNRLSDGAVVYLNDADQWTVQLGAAARFGETDAEHVLAAALRRETEIAGAYLIDLDGIGAPAGRAAFRETIRSRGPTIAFGINEDVS